MSAWVLSGVPAILLVLGWAHWEKRPHRLPPVDFTAWAASWAVFILAFWLTSGSFGEEHLRKRNRLLLVVQSLAALLMFHFVCTGLETTLLAVVAAQLGVYVRLPIGLLWMGVQTVALAGLGLWHWDPVASVGWVSLTLPFQALAFFTSYFAASEHEARRSLASTNAELLATRELFVESSRVAERGRIASELHDLLGHHLTALSLNLEVARHGTDGESRSQIEKCQGLAKKLLGDVRDAVRSLKVQQPVDLARVLSPLTADIPRPKIHLTVPPGVEIYEPEHAHALVRCVQEIITNSVRHSGADNLWIELIKTDHRLEFRASDDGRGAPILREGEGLSGMRRRLEQLGGRLDIRSTPSQGFRLSAVLPLPGTSL